MTFNDHEKTAIALLDDAIRQRDEALRKLDATAFDVIAEENRTLRAEAQRLRSTTCTCANVRNNELRLAEENDRLLRVVTAMGYKIDILSAERNECLDDLEAATARADNLNKRFMQQGRRLKTCEEALRAMIQHAITFWPSWGDSVACAEARAPLQPTDASESGSPCGASQTSTGPSIDGSSRARVSGCMSPEDGSQSGTTDGPIPTEREFPANTPTTDAVEILHRRYAATPERQASLEMEREEAASEAAFTTEEGAIHAAIIAARDVQDFLWGEVDGRWCLDAWRRMLRKRLDKLDALDLAHPHAAVELRKRLLQLAALSVAALAVVGRNGLRALTRKEASDDE